jgi:hypothetical protein
MIMARHIRADLAQNPVIPAHDFGAGAPHAQTAFQWRISHAHFAFSVFK